MDEHEWIAEVIDDLGEFAILNGLEALGEDLRHLNDRFRKGRGVVPMRPAGGHRTCGTELGNAHGITSTVVRLRG